MTRTDAVLGLLALLLAGLLAVRIDAGLEEPPDNAPVGAPMGMADAPGRVEAPPATGFVPPPLADFDAVLARPLFVPERRPAPARAATPSVPGELRLVGVVTAHGRAAAVLRAADGRTFTAGAGEGGGGWSVVAVGSDRAVVERDGARHELMLAARSRAPATVTAARPSPAHDPGDPGDPRDPGDQRKSGRP